MHIFNYMFRLDITLFDSCLYPLNQHVAYSKMRKIEDIAKITVGVFGGSYISAHHLITWSLRPVAVMHMLHSDMP